MIRVSRGRTGRPRRVNGITLHGTVRVVYAPDQPMPWGARVWLEVDED